MIAVTADTTKFKESLLSAAQKVRTLPAGYEMHRGPDWEQRLWSLTEKLAVCMADRCQDGLMTPEDYGKLVYAMASWTVNAAYYRGRQPATPEEVYKEIERLFGGKKK